MGGGGAGGRGLSIHKLVKTTKFPICGGLAWIFYEKKTFKNVH